MRHAYGRNDVLLREMRKDIQVACEEEKNIKSEKMEKENSVKHGIIYGLLPHTGCIAFIIASVFGVTIATQLFKHLLLNPYFFYILILLSFAFATVSAVFYLKKQGLITFVKDGNNLKLNIFPNTFGRKWKYLSTLYGTTIGVNLVLFMIVFPLLANVGSSSPANANLASIRLKVEIPCSGHASLITQELKSVNGVEEVKFALPNIFDVKYDAAKTTKQQILALEVFKTYKASVLV